MTHSPGHKVLNRTPVGPLQAEWSQTIGEICWCTPIAMPWGDRMALKSNYPRVLLEGRMSEMASQWVSLASKHWADLFYPIQHELGATPWEQQGLWYNWALGFTSSLHWSLSGVKCGREKWFYFIFPLPFDWGGVVMVGIILWHADGGSPTSLDSESWKGPDVI